MSSKDYFELKRFSLRQANSGMKIGTDGVLLGAWATPLSAAVGLRIWDIGAGTGIVALMMAQRFPQARITAFEIEPGASSDARSNFGASEWSERISLVEGDVFEAESELRETADLIVCNPPFYTEDVASPTANRQTARHEAGLGIGSLIEFAARHLSPRGALCLVGPYSRKAEIDFLCAMNHLAVRKLTEIVTVEGKPAKRGLWKICRDNIGTAVETDRIVIRDKEGRYTPKYIVLVRDFYLNF